MYSNIVRLLPITATSETTLVFMALVGVELFDFNSGSVSIKSNG